MRTDPVILIGMHRSGTSMAARLLERLGVFMGSRRDDNHEADFFRRANEWLLAQSGAAWDNAEPVRALLSHEAGRAMAGEHLCFLLHGPRVVSYTGLRHPRRLRSAGGRWGWKDPRNTYTLPLWMDLFPECRVVHVSRHGVDVASSLVRRSERSLAQRVRSYRSHKWLYHVRARRGGFVESYRCARLDGALDLWSEYTAEARRQVEALGERAVAVRYEDLLERPVATLAQIVDSLGLVSGNGSLENAAAIIRSDRAYAYRQEAELTAFAQRRRDALRAEGYDA